MKIKALILWVAFLLLPLNCVAEMVYTFIWDDGYVSRLRFSDDFEVANIEKIEEGEEYVPPIYVITFLGKHAKIEIKAGWTDWGIVDKDGKKIFKEGEPDELEVDYSFTISERGSKIVFGNLPEDTDVDVLTDDWDDETNRYKDSMYLTVTGEIEIDPMDKYRQIQWPGVDIIRFSPRDESDDFSKNPQSENPSGSSPLVENLSRGDEQEVWRAKVKIDGKPILIDLAGNYITEPGKYQYIGNFAEGLCEVQRDGKYGYINVYGDEVIPCSWAETFCFSNGFAMVADSPRIYKEEPTHTLIIQNEKGLINKKGEKVIYPPKYSDIQAFKGGKLISTEGPTELLDSKGNVLFSNLFSIYNLQDGWIVFDVNGNYKNYLYNPETQVKLGPYREIQGGFNHGYCALKLRDRNKGEVSCYINTSGDKFIIDKYDKTYQFDKNGYANVYKDGKYGLINTNFEEIIPCIYKDIQKLGDSGLFLVYRENSEGERECAMVNSNNELLIPFGRYTQIKEIGKSNFYCGYLMCPDGTKSMQVLLTKNGERANPYEYSDFSGNFDHGVIRGKRDGKDVLINKEGKEIAITDYDIEWNDLYSWVGVLRIYDDATEKYGLMTPEGKIIVPPTYDRIWSFCNGEAPVVKDKKQGFINKEGKIVVPLVEQDIYDENNNYECDRRGMRKVIGNAWKYGYKSKAGVEVIPCVFDEISAFKKVSVK